MYKRSHLVAQVESARQELARAQKSLESHDATFRTGHDMMSRTRAIEVIALVEDEPQSARHLVKKSQGRFNQTEVRWALRLYNIKKKRIDGVFHYLLNRERVVQVG